MSALLGLKALRRELDAIIEAMEPTPKPAPVPTDADVFAQWLATACEVDHGNDSLVARSMALYLSWRAFAEIAGVSPGSSKTFRPELEGLGFKAKRQADSVYFYGIRLRD